MHIHLVHRSIRIQDNTSLITQLKIHEKVQVIFIFTPEQISPKKNKYFTNNGAQFMIESLHELSDDVKKYGGKLLFFHGDTIKVLKSIHKIKLIESISFNYEYTPYGRIRSQHINKWASINNIIVYEKEDYVLFDLLDGKTNKDNGTPYLVYTPFMKHLKENITEYIREVDKFRSFDFNKYTELNESKYYIEEKEIDKFYDNNIKINVRGGRSNTLKILNGIGKFKDYEKKRDNMTYRTTLLGASNKFGTCSIREVYHAIVNELGENCGLIRELIWRDFYINVSVNFPHVLKGMIKGKNQSYKKEYDNIKWSYNKEHLRKWCESMTGFPIVDACMKELAISGFMHNRGRMIVASFLTKDLHIDWRMGEQYFATQLCDYDPMVNCNSWQWCAGSGTDAQPWFRIFNPWSQQEKFDPECIYIKKWLPELKNVPNKDLHNWLKPEIHKQYLESGIKYYKPMLIHDEERKETIKLYKNALK
jgi:deoxyribodipyrimidine photo-lyase